MKNFKWHVALLVFVLTVTVSAGVIIFRQRKFLNAPLFDRLNRIEAVDGVNI